MIGLVARTLSLRSLGLLAAAAALAAGGYWAVRYDPSSGQARAAAGTAAAPDRTLLSEMLGRERTITLPPEQAFSEIIMRPLFSPTRRPPATPASTATAATGTLAHLALSGIVITPDLRFALLEQQWEPRFLHVAEGDLVDGWTLEAIKADRVIFQAASQRHEMLLTPEIATSTE